MTSPANRPPHPLHLSKSYLTFKAPFKHHLFCEASPDSSSKTDLALSLIWIQTEIYIYFLLITYGCLPCSLVIYDHSWLLSSSRRQPPREDRRNPFPILFLVRVSPVAGTRPCPERLFSQHLLNIKWQKAMCAWLHVLWCVRPQILRLGCFCGAWTVYFLADFFFFFFFFSFIFKFHFYTFFPDPWPHFHFYSSGPIPFSQIQYWGFLPLKTALPRYLGNIW